jgi:hypothetical protein
MSERMAAEIHIGGKIPAAVAVGLAGVVQREGVSLEWGGGRFEPESAQALLEASQDGDDGTGLLRLYDDQARWGEFEELEAFCRQHHVAYTRHSEGRYDCGPETAEYRPEQGLFVFLTDPSHQPYVLANQLVDVEKKLAEAIGHLEQRRFDRALAAAREARDMMRKQLPPELPPLEPFEIVEDASPGG